MASTKPQMMALHQTGSAVIFVSVSKLQQELRARCPHCTPWGGARRWAKCPFTGQEGNAQCVFSWRESSSSTAAVQPMWESFLSRADCKTCLNCAVLIWANPVLATHTLLPSDNCYKLQINNAVDSQTFQLTLSRPSSNPAQAIN